MAHPRTPGSGRIWPSVVTRVEAPRPGSRIAIVAPSSGLAVEFPGVYRRGLDALRGLGIEPVEYPTVRASGKELYGDPGARVDDFRSALSDSSIDGVISAIGGYESVRLLPRFRPSWFAKRPVFMMGGSDATTFLLYARRLGIVSFYGPSVMAGLSQTDDLPSEFAQHLASFLAGGWETYEYAPFPSYTHGYTGWSGDSPGGIGALRPNGGWRVLQGDRAVTGHLWGGCIEVIEFLKATRFWPHRSFFDRSVLFFETSEEKPTPDRVGYMLRNYGIAGILGRASAMLMGRPKDYTDAEQKRLDELIVEIVAGEFGRGDMPIVSNVDFGHTDPKLILPIGSQIRVDPVRNRLSLIESPFRS